MSGSQRQSPEGACDQPPRIACLESIRGLAALQVLLLHFFGGVRAEPCGFAAGRRIHWSILFGPSAALFLALNGMVGIELSRNLRSRMSDALQKMPRQRTPRADRMVPAE